MYAIVKVGGQQFSVSENDVIETQKVGGNVGDQVELDQVLLLSTGDEVKVGSPAVDGAKIQATVMDHFKSKTVTVFKKKRRKGYKVKNGHRQQLTRLKIDTISM
jgi:large subunit ribosomal protein L21